MSPEESFDDLGIMYCPDCKGCINTFNSYCCWCGIKLPLPPTIRALELQEVAEKKAHSHSPEARPPDENIKFCSVCGEKFQAPQSNQEAQGPHTKI